MKTAAAAKGARPDLVGARRIERSPRAIDRSTGEEIAPKIKHCVPVLDDRRQRHDGGFAQHGKAMGPTMRPPEMADPPRSDQVRRTPDLRASKPHCPDTDYYSRWLTLEPYHPAVLSRYYDPHAYGRDSSGERIGGAFYRRQFDVADPPTPKQEGDRDRVSSSSPAAAGRPARPGPSSASLATGVRTQSESQPKVLLGTSSDKTVYQRSKGRGRRTRDEKRKSRSGRDTRAKQHTVSAPCFSSALGPQRPPQNGAERQTENLDLITFDDGVRIGGLDASRTPPSTREIQGSPSNQVPQDQKLSGRGGVTRYVVQERWNSYISANVDTAMNAGYRCEKTDKDDAEKERSSNAFAELQSVHKEENASDFQSLVSHHEGQRRQDDDDHNRSELVKIGAFQRISSNHDPSSSNARLMRKDTFSGLNDLLDNGTVETNSVVRKRVIRSQGESECKGISSFKSQTPRTEKNEEKKQAEKVEFSGMSRFDLKRSLSDGALTYPEATPSNRLPVPDGFVLSLAANASDSWETVSNSSCASKIELIDCSDHSPALIPYNEPLHASYAEPFAAATALESIHSIPSAGHANVFELKVPIWCPPALRRSAETVEDFIAEFPEDASSQNNSLPDGRHFASSIPDRFPTYLTSRPIVVGFQMKERGVSPRGFRDSFGCNFLDNRCLDEDRSMQSTPDVLYRIPPSEQSATTMSPVLLSPRPQFSDGHAQSPRSLASRRYIPTYVNRQRTELDGPWTMAAAAEVDDDDYWQSDYTDPCLCLHGDLLRRSVDGWEVTNEAPVYSGRLRRRPRTQRRLKPEKRNPRRSAYTAVKPPLENPRLMEEVFRNVDGAGHSNRAPPLGAGASDFPAATPSPRPQSNREVVPLVEGRSRSSGVDTAARSTTQERNFDAVRMRCPGIEIVTSEDERRSMINATNHGNTSARTVDGSNHVQTPPRGERAAGESKAATQTQVEAEEHKRKLEERMRMLGALQAFCLVLAVGAYVLLYLIYFKQ